MKKLDLNLDDLTVESFEASKTSSGQGTVVGQAGTDILQENNSLMDCIYETSCMGGYYCPIEPQMNDGDDAGGYDPADPFSPDANEDPIW